MHLIIIVVHYLDVDDALAPINVTRQEKTKAPSKDKKDSHAHFESDDIKLRQKELKGDALASAIIRFEVLVKEIESNHKK